jgi:ABC-2 type transport system permease protein
MNTGRFFWILTRTNAQILAHRVRELGQQSRLMIAVVGLFILSYAVFGYHLFHWAFRFLYSVPGLNVLLPAQMLNMYFAFLMFMLFFGNIIVGYASLFRNAETGWLMTLPIRHVDVFRWKFIESTVLSSWAFLFLSAPLMFAYGQVRNVDWQFYVKVICLYLPFVVIPAVLGAWAILFIARYLHRRVFKLLLLALCVAALVFSYVLMKPTDINRLSNSQYEQLFHEMMQNTRFASFQGLPSYWITQSILAWGDGEWDAGRFYFLVLLSNSLLAGLTCFGGAGRFFYGGWASVHGREPRSLRRRLDDSIAAKRVSRTRSWIDRLVDCFRWVKRPTRALVIKDLKTFWRDTTQWSQFVVFFGLLALYILNLRNIKYDKDSLFWQNLVSFLNLAASSMTLATLTTRFVFPQFSLEGKRLWLVGMAPLGLKKVLWEKFWLSAAGSVLVTSTLSILSCLMLRLEGRMILFFVFTVICMSLTLSGLAVGLGALYPNFKVDNPAKIVSGFGGTFCLVLSLIYIVGIIAFEAAWMHMELFRRNFGVTVSDTTLLTVLAVVALMSFLLCALPTLLASRKLESLEI